MLNTPVNGDTTSNTDSGSSGTPGTSKPRSNGNAVAGTATTSTSSTYSIGGTVSGLSGTVVLQDNGGDDLSVSSNGAFTFGTQLPDGAAYDVTVKSTPSGETCTISNGAGTIASANVTTVAVTCITPPTSATDDFNRADGGLGADWTAMSDGGLSISSQEVVGTAGALAGDVRVGESYGSDQYSRVEVTSSALPVGDWVGPTVRSQNGGQDTYLGLYWNDQNTGKYELQVYVRKSGSWVQLGGTYTLSGPLAAGTQLTLSAVGSKISFQENGVERIGVTDTTLTGGAPGLMTYGAATADNWAGGKPGTYSIGGTVSGLSGTLVLQDNGGDDLSVSTDGAFTFTTPLADGTSYSVTFKSSPSGQVCKLSGAAGTVASANVTSVVVTCITPPTSATDDFDRADGGLGADWAAMSDGGLSISSQQVVGTAGALAGDIRVGESYGSDQYSQVEVTSASLPVGDWVGPTVRTQNGGQDTYLGIYWNDQGSGKYELQLYVRKSGSWVELGGTYTLGGALPAGTQLTLSAVGSKISFQENGVERVGVTDTTLTGGAPGLMTYGAATADNWAGGNGAGATQSTYSIGGTVSGLSGTLVLQDNGGDDLSVSSNGPFTFATPVVNGGPYNVTVKTSPSGESCTVSSGAGTVASANVTSVAVACSASTATTGQDDFNRADGGLGAGWAAMSDGGLSISSQEVVGTAGAQAGDIRVGESYGSDQYSQIEVTSTQLSGGEWIGPTVRSQNGGQDLYAGIYFWNNGDPQLRLYKRTGGTWTQLGSSYDSGPLSAGTQLTLSAVGSTISFQEGGAERISATDTTLTGGAPGLMMFDVATADNWAGGNATASPPPTAPFTYRSTDANGVAYYDINSPDDGYGTQTLRVLAPTHPAPGVPHNFLYVLPVESQLGSSFGDGLETMASLDAEDQYNLTIIEPSFALDPWYADNPTDPNVQYETFMTKDLVPWVTQNLTPPAGAAATDPFAPLTGQGQNWLIGFSKSGFAAMDLLLKHPDVFTLAASWDFPADMLSYNEFGPGPASVYGTDANFQANYRLTPSFVDAHKTPFVSQNRIWLGGYQDFQTDMADYDALLSSEGILHTTESQPMAHRWDSGWVPLALSALSQEGAALAPSL